MSCYECLLLSGPDPEGTNVGGGDGKAEPLGRCTALQGPLKLLGFSHSNRSYLAPFTLKYPC